MNTGRLPALRESSGLPAVSRGAVGRRGPPTRRPVLGAAGGYGPMGALEALYRGQSSHDWYAAEQQSLHREANERAVTIGQVAAERTAAAEAYRQSETERVAAIVNDPALLARLKRYWSRGITGENIQDPLAPAPAPRTGPPSAGRTVSGG